jgi:hypothetical protein
MLAWQSLVHVPEDHLARLDLAEVNLSCAVGLPGADRIDATLCLRTLDEWAARCGRFTVSVMPYFRRGQCDYADSEPKFRIQAMATHLQRDLGVKYHPERVTDGAVFKSEDSFVHGVIQGEGGTCGNLPIIYAAVGRRLGYPIRLVTARNHLFCRWDAAPSDEVFNIEASGVGVSFLDDNHYRTGRYETAPEAVAAFGFLQSLSPREELAGFLCQRGECWMQEHDYGQAVTAFAWANEVDPRRVQHGQLAQQALRVWREVVRHRVPASRYFPRLDLGLPAQRFRHLTGISSAR